MQPLPAEEVSEWFFLAWIMLADGTLAASTHGPYEDSSVCAQWRDAWRENSGYLATECFRMEDRD